MQTKHRSHIVKLSVIFLLSAGAGACGASDDGGEPMPGSNSPSTSGTSTGGSATGSAGTSNTGGNALPGSAGQAPTAGTGSNSGGTPGAAGTPNSSGGSQGGNAPIGGGGVSAGGAASGGGSSGGNSGGVSTGGGSTGACVVGQTKGAEVAVIGESFIAATHGITKEIEKKAQAAGSLASGEHYVDNSVSGTTLANNQIPSQYTKAAMSGKIRYVLMDGGGNDCLLNSDGAAALAAATTLFQTMGTDKVEKVQYFFYPDPIGGSFGSLKTCLDDLRPKMKALCDGLTSPKCYWLDLRPTWNGHNEYTSDGIHPTDAGAVATGDVIWDAMKTNCVAQ